MRYFIAILVVSILVAALFLGHWLVSEWVEATVQNTRNQLGVGPDDVAINIPESLEMLLVSEELLYGLRFVLIPIIFATGLVVAHLWRSKTRKPI
jgi:hypothetical protein